MRLWSPVLVVSVVVAGCGEPPVPEAQKASGACATLEEAVEGQLAVILTNVTWGLGPDGGISGVWANGTVDVLLDNETFGSVTLDANGCGSIALQHLGRYTFRAHLEGTCTLDGEAALVQAGPAGHVVVLRLSFPCA